jgi:hypothetical protein
LYVLTPRKGFSCLLKNEQQTILGDRGQYLGSRIHLFYIKEGAFWPLLYFGKLMLLPRIKFYCKIQGIIPVRRKFFV